MNSLDSILEALQKMSESKVPINASQYLDGAEKLNALLQNEQDKLIEMDFVLAKMRAAILAQGKTVSYAKVVIEASEEYKETRKLKNKINTAQETVRLAKRHATLASDTLRGM